MTSFEAFDGHSWAMKDKTVILEKKRFLNTKE